MSAEKLYSVGVFDVETTTYDTSPFLAPAARIAATRRRTGVLGVVPRNVFFTTSGAEALAHVLSSRLAGAPFSALSFEAPCGEQVKIELALAPEGAVPLEPSPLEDGRDAYGVPTDKSRSRRVGTLVRDALDADSQVDEMWTQVYAWSCATASVLLPLRAIAAAQPNEEVLNYAANVFPLLSELFSSVSNYMGEHALVGRSLSFKWDADMDLGQAFFRVDIFA